MSKIEWIQADDGSEGKTWNPVRGCSRVSPGCGQGGLGGCYAERLAIRMAGSGQPYEGLVKSTSAGPRWTGKIRLAPPDILRQPLHWRKPARIFVNSMSDLFHERLDALDIAVIWKVMRAAPQHQFLILTKRADRMKQWIREWIKGGGEVLPNVHLGVSIETPAYLWRAMELAEIPAAIRFISYEPALEPVDFHPVLCKCKGQLQACCGGPSPIHQIIVGGESGPNARPFDLAWARAVRTECRAAKVRYFFKQAGARPYDSEDPAAEKLSGCQQKNARETRFVHVGEKLYRWLKLEDSKGADLAELPEEFRVREFVGMPV